MRKLRLDSPTCTQRMRDKTESWSLHSGAGHGRMVGELSRNTVEIPGLPAEPLIPLSGMTGMHSQWQSSQRSNVTETERWIGQVSLKMQWIWCRADPWAGPFDLTPPWCGCPPHGALKVHINNRIPLQKVQLPTIPHTCSAAEPIWLFLQVAFGFPK